MKNLLFSLLLTCITLAGNSQAILVGHYPLNGNATDISPTQNNGTLNGATPYPDRFGNAGGAMYLGQGNSIDFSTLPPIWDGVNPFGFGAYTVVFWTKITGVSGNNIFISLGDGSVTGENGITLESNLNSIRISTYTGPLFSVAQLSLTTGGFVNQWIMLAYRFNGINHLNGLNYGFFLNTSKADSSLQIASCPGCGPGKPYPLSNTMRFGWAPGSRYLDGALDDVRIYSGTLTDSSVIALFTAGSVGTEEVNAAPFSIYPNPTSDVVHVNSTKPIETVSIYDVSGRVVANVLVNDLQSFIDVSGFNPGFYVIKVKAISGSTSQIKFIKN